MKLFEDLLPLPQRTGLVRCARAVEETNDLWTNDQQFPVSCELRQTDLEKLFRVVNCLLCCELWRGSVASEFDKVRNWTCSKKSSLTEQPQVKLRTSHSSRPCRAGQAFLRLTQPLVGGKTESRDHVARVVFAHLGAALLLLMF